MKPAYAKRRYFTSAHHHFIEIRETVNGDPYLVIDQSTKNGDRFESQKIVLFQDEVAGFLHAVQSVLGDIESGCYRSKPVDHDSGDLMPTPLDGARGNERPRAIPLRDMKPKWTHQDSENLLLDYEMGMSISELANKYTRSPGAIKSRMVRLGKTWEEITPWANKDQ